MDYEQYESLIQNGISYVKRLKGHAVYRSGEAFDIPEEVDSGQLKDEEIVIYYYGDNK